MSTHRDLDVVHRVSGSLAVAFVALAVLCGAIALIVEGKLSSTAWGASAALAIGAIALSAYWIVVRQAVRGR